MKAGIESINPYVGRLYCDVRQLFDARGLQIERFENLMMREKSVNLPCEDSVTNAVNAAKPLVDALSDHEREQIEAVIVGTESGLDHGKPISTYIHHYLGLRRQCRSFEVKHACYGGTAALRTAMGLVATSPNPQAKILVIAADAASAAARDTYWEPSQGAGAVAMIVGAQPDILEIDPGAAGLYSYEVMDTCRPRPDLEAGDSDLSLLSYLHCLEQSFADYRGRVASADIVDTFDYLVFHTPFAGMVRGAHRTLLRREKRAPTEQIERDFESRLRQSIVYCQRVGNIYSTALYLALCSFIDHARFEAPKRVGLFSYGSGCASEFYSGVVTERAQGKLATTAIGKAIDSRRQLALNEYEQIVDLALQWRSCVQDKPVDRTPYMDIYHECFEGEGLLVLDAVQKFHREYTWS